MLEGPNLTWVCFKGIQVNPQQSFQCMGWVSNSTEIIRPPYWIAGSWMGHTQFSWFGGSTEGLLDLAEVEDHGQLVYLSTVGQVASGHDRRDAQLLLQDTKCQLIVVNSTGLIQRRHVTGEESQRLVVTEKLLTPTVHCG